MLKFMCVLSMILLTSLRFFMLKELITYKKEGLGNYKVVFCFLLPCTAILYNLREIIGVSDNLTIGIISIIWIFYYNYFYKTGCIKYIILFFMLNLYLDLFENIVFRILYIAVTGYSNSSPGGLLVSNFESQKIDLYSKLLMIFIYLTFTFINKKLLLFNSEKRNYVFLCLALLVNIVNIIGKYLVGVYLTHSNELNNILTRLKNLVPAIKYEWGYFDQIITPKLVLASSIIVILLFRETIRVNKLKSQQKLLKNKLDMQYEHYLSIQESHMNVKKLYHDINNHIYCIENLNNTNGKINEYVNNLKDEIKEFKFINNTGNMILDIIVNEKGNLCTKKGIKFICDINFSKVEFMKPIDISSIFTNILDNAIEACEKIQDENINKFIRIKGTIVKSLFVIKLENSKINNIKIKKDILLTDKICKSMHGIGIQNVKSSLQKYSGELLFEDKKDKFVIIIYIPLN